MALSTSKTDNVASVLKVVAVIETLSQMRQAPLALIAQRAMTSKSTTHRLLQTLVDLDYVAQDPETEQYSLTLKLFSVGAQALKTEHDLLRLADRGMGRLSQATGESINLGVMDERKNCVVYVHARASTFGLSMQSTIGQRNPLHSTSLGKALLAWRDLDEIEERLTQIDMVAQAPKTITDRDALRAEMERTRARGYAEEIEESEAGVRCMAVPVRDHLGKTVAAISMSFPLFRFDESKRDTYANLLCEVGEDLSRKLGFEP